MPWYASGVGFLIVTCDMLWDAKTRLWASTMFALGRPIDSCACFTVRGHPVLLRSSVLCIRCVGSDKLLGRWFPVLDAHAL